MKRFGLFRTGSLGYAVPIEQLRKILQGATTYRLPRLPEPVGAVLVDGGELVPLLNLQGLMAGASVLPDCLPSGYQVLVDSEYGPVALPAEATGRIVPEQKGELAAVAEELDSWVSGEFQYRDEKYKILDIDFLAIEMTQGFWRDQPDTCGTRRLE